MPLTLTLSRFGLRLLPRQDGGRNGRIRTFELYVSDDPLAFGKAVATDTRSDELPGGADRWKHAAPAEGVGGISGCAYTMPGSSASRP